ncbi:hypothetical protein NQ315_005249 [Exocentrus adspersus]|uniref:Uncharacterized protein n=1 Tax=Exocentrus adspersus TaxID=1586481 RepID=A0AAV8W1M1_9CUCU|nr:hypothetical protein NQ315_005249 [Exocentrus adspersus]
MMLLAVLAFVASAAAARLENTYLPPISAQTAGGNSNILSTPLVNPRPPTSLYAPPPATRLGNTYLPPSTSGSFNLVASSRFGSSATATVSTPTALYGVPSAAVSYSGPVTPPVPILRLNNENNGDGSYRYEYETANHIAAQESGRLVSQDSSEVQGSYSYLAPNGQTITVQYIADENGFRPAGDHLPTPPPIPEAILKSLEINAAEAARGIVDNGQYRAGSGSVNTQYLPPVTQQGGYRY